MTIDNRLFFRLFIPSLQGPNRDLKKAQNKPNGWPLQVQCNDTVRPVPFNIGSPVHPTKPEEIT